MTMPSYSHDLHFASGRVSTLFYPGPRTPVVAIHGNSASKEVFGSQISVLRKAGFAVVALDLPGHGASENARDPAATYSFPGYAKVIGAVMDAFSIERAHVIGWSLGGHIGLELMGCDRRVESLLIWGTPPVTPGVGAVTDAFLAGPEMNLAGQADLSAEDCERYARAMIADANGLTSTLARSVRRTDGQARYWMLRNALDGVGIDAFGLVERDERQITIIHGAADPFVNLAFLTTPRYRNLWRGHIQILPGIGHAAHLQAPDAFNAILIASLPSHPLSRRESDAVSDRMA